MNDRACRVVYWLQRYYRWIHMRTGNGLPLPLCPKGIKPVEQFEWRVAVESAATT